MTEASRTTGARGRRARPAARARVVAAGVAAGAAFTMVAAMALPDGGSVSATPTGQAILAGQRAPDDGRVVAPATAAPSGVVASAPDTSTGGS